jgi:hypothetical protein
MKKDQIYYISRTKSIKGLVICIIFLCISIYFLIAIRSNEIHLIRKKPIIFILIGIPFFGILFLHFLKNILHPTKSLIINSFGITQNDYIGYTKIPWQDIEDFEVINYSIQGQKQYSICIILSNIHNSTHQTMISKLNSRFIRTNHKHIISINSDILDIHNEELLSILKHNLLLNKTNGIIRGKSNEHP